LGVASYRDKKVVGVFVRFSLRRFQMGYLCTRKLIHIACEVTGSPGLEAVKVEQCGFVRSETVGRPKALGFQNQSPTLLARIAQIIIEA
jgi:hypothetical protein